MAIAKINIAVNPSAVPSKFAVSHVNFSGELVTYILTSLPV